MPPLVHNAAILHHDLAVEHGAGCLQLAGGGSDRRTLGCQVVAVAREHFGGAVAQMQLAMPAVASELTFYTDDSGIVLSDLAAAHRYGVSLVWNCMRCDTEERDWSGWHVKIADDTGRTLVIVLFPTAWSRTFDPHGASGCGTSE
jgi:hypothetical protein